MSRFSVLITICGIFCILISEVFSVVTYEQMTRENNNYQRICGSASSSYPTPTTVCNQVAQQSDTSPSSSNATITGECKKVDVKLKNANGKWMNIGDINMVMCSYNDNLAACASASSDDTTIEYFKYVRGTSSIKKRCEHAGSFTLST